MLNVILNESKVIQEALQGNIQNYKTTQILQLLLKHYYLEGITDKLQLKEKILGYLQQYYTDYQRSKWENTINRMVKQFLKLTKNPNVKIKIMDIKKIDITKNELQIIEKLNDRQLEKIAFIMLVYGKIANVMFNNNNNKDKLKDCWINQSCTTICKEARVGLQGIEKTRIFHEFYKKKYIEQSKHNTKTNMKICYIDTNYKKEDVALTITNFEGVVYQYLIWKGEKWIQCENCNKWIRQKSNKTKYCPKCAKEIREQQNREKALKYYYKTKNFTK